MFRVKLSAVEEEGLILVDVSHATKPFFLPLSCVSWLQGICVDYYANVLTTSQITFSNYVSFFFLPLLLFEIRERSVVFEKYAREESRGLFERKEVIFFFFSPSLKKMINAIERYY